METVAHNEKDLYKSHMALSKSISDFGVDLKNVNSKIDRITQTLDDHGDTIVQMLKQTTATNGTVRALQLWQAGIKGTVYGVGVCITVIISLVSLVFWLQVNSVDGSIGNVEKLLNQHIDSSK